MHRLQRVCCTTPSFFKSPLLLLRDLEHPKICLLLEFMSSVCDHISFGKKVWENRSFVARGRFFVSQLTWLRSWLRRRRRRQKTHVACSCSVISWFCSRQSVKAINISESSVHLKKGKRKEGRRWDKCGTNMRHREIGTSFFFVRKRKETSKRQGDCGLLREGNKFVKLLSQCQ